MFFTHACLKHALNSSAFFNPIAIAPLLIKLYQIRFTAPPLALAVVVVVEECSKHFKVPARMRPLSLEYT